MTTYRPPKRRRPATVLSDEGPDYLSRDQALKALGVKAATLYTYVSRGLIKSIPDSSSRTSRYARADVEHLVARSQAHAGLLARAETAMRWGEPIISTQITEITPDGPRYRGRSAIDLARGGTSFEAIANFLWTGALGDEHLRFGSHKLSVEPDRVIASLGVGFPPTDVQKLFAILVLSGGLPDRGLNEFRDGGTIASAQQIIQILAGACGYLHAPYRFAAAVPREAIATMIARALGAGDPRTVDLINAALVLCADLELAPGTFAARIAASAGSDLYACVATGIGAHAGVLTGRGSDKAEDLLRDVSRKTLKRNLDVLKTHGRKLYGFNHPYFPKGDPRADLLINWARSINPLPKAARQALWFLDEAREQHEAYPGMAVGLVILCLALGLPRHSAVALWSVSRAAGQIAHVLEQRMQGFVMRPRARYSGSPPAAHSVSSTNTR
jgi:citrate synthase